MCGKREVKCGKFRRCRGCEDEVTIHPSTRVRLLLRTKTWEPPVTVSLCDLSIIELCIYPACEKRCQGMERRRADLKRHVVDSPWHNSKFVGLERRCHAHAAYHVDTIATLRCWHESSSSVPMPKVEGGVQMAKVGQWRHRAGSVGRRCWIQPQCSCVMCSNINPKRPLCNSKIFVCMQIAHAIRRLLWQSKPFPLDTQARICPVAVEHNDSHRSIM
mmetsp:Transcript_2261/g.6927  ORF Transcript_2261/g.6927 Transcript_2261/m.6927 type:complete len:217 (+) Transcript_2261:1529-2179(+)